MKGIGMVTTMETKLQERIGKFIRTHYGFQEPASDYETRRVFPRYPMAEMVDVMIDSKTTPADMVQATGRDISTGGIGLYSHRPIPAGTEMIVSVDTGKTRLLTRAVAVHNTVSVGLFKVGARFIV